jgi:hypothetical protein
MVALAPRWYGLGHMGCTSRRALLLGATGGLTVVASAWLGCAAGPRPAVHDLDSGSHVTLRLIMRTPAGTPRPVEIAQPVFAGDQLALEIHGGGVTHAHVLLGDDLVAKTAGPIADGAPLRAPAGSSWLQLAGAESTGRITVVATSTVIDDARAREIAEAWQKRRDLDERIVAIDPAYGASRRPGPTQVAKPRRTFRLRGPWLVEDPKAGGMRAEGFPEDEAIVVELRVQTDRPRRF